MIAVSFETKKDPKEILDKAIKYFVNKVGLEIVKQNDCSITFEDKKRIGCVNIMVSKKDEKFEVEVESREFEYDAKEFAKEF